MISRIADRFKGLLERPKRHRIDTRTDATGSWMKIAPGVEGSASDTGLTILDTNGGRVFVGSDVAALMWVSASKGLSFSETAEVIAVRLGAGRNAAEDRIRVFLELLEENGLTLRKAINR